MKFTSIPVRAVSAILPALLSTILPATRADAQTTVLISANPDGYMVSGGGSYTDTNRCISADGRFVTFDSYAKDVVPGDKNEAIDVFIHDRKTGLSTRVSVDSHTNEADGPSYLPSVSADGRFVAFTSDATTLLPLGEDSNGKPDVFVHDTKYHTTIRVSVDSYGNQGDERSYAPSISADGRFVAFVSDATNLVPPGTDTNGESDVFVHDTKYHTTIRVSVDSYGNQGDGGSYGPSISATGQFVAFESTATNLVYGDTNKVFDIFVHETCSTTRVSLDSHHHQANGHSSAPSISADGRFVTFTSLAKNLVSFDNNNDADAFVHDRQTGLIARVSVDSYGSEANSASYSASTSADGRFVVFESFAYNLLPGGKDTNGTADIFLHDRDADGNGILDELNGMLTTRMSVAFNGNQAFYGGSSPSISADGRVVAFSSDTNSLVHGEANQESDVFVRALGPRVVLGYYGEPMSGVTVQFASNSATFSTTTLKDGTCEVPVMPQDNYTVRAFVTFTEPETGQQSIPIVNYPNTKAHKQYRLGGQSRDFIPNIVFPEPVILQAGWHGGTSTWTRRPDWSDNRPYNMKGYLEEDPVKKGPLDQPSFLCFLIPSSEEHPGGYDHDGDTDLNLKADTLLDWIRTRFDPIMSQWVRPKDFAGVNYSIVAHSMGGLITRALATQHPAYICRLVGLDCVHGGSSKFYKV